MPFVFVPDDAALECQLLKDIINLTMDANVPPDASLAAQLLKEIRDGLAYVPFKIIATADQIKTGDDLPITQCPALPAGYAWEVISAVVKLDGSTIPFDGFPVIFIKTNGTSKGQFQDDGGTLSSGNNCFTPLGKYTVITDGYFSVISESGALMLSFNNISSTTGNGILTIYGLARKITL